MIATQVQRRTQAWGYLAFALLAVLSSIFLVRNVDLRVYWYGVNGFFNGTQPAYGPKSGLLFPMEYRYPPVTYLLLVPLRWMSLRVAGFVWMLFAWFTAGAAVLLAVRIRKLSFNRKSLLAIAVLMASNLVLAVRYGNVQPFVISWLFAALVLSETYPFCAGLLLALAVSFKIWPIMFVPWLFHRPRIKSAFYFAASLAGLWVLPLAFFGVQGYWTLLKDWYAAVSRVGTTYSEFYYFPGESLRGLLLRYFTPVAPAMDSFPHINVLSLDPRTAVIAWGVLGLAGYCFIAIQMLRSNPRKLWAWDGAIFLLYSLIEPYAVKSGLMSIGPAVLVAACLFTRGNSSGAPAAGRFISLGNRLFLAACTLAFFETAAQYRPLQRYLLSFGLDFWIEILLLAAMCVWITRTPLAETPRPEP